MRLQLDYAKQRHHRAHVCKGVRVRKIGSVHGLKVYAVDGERIRRDTFVDFTQGGNGAVYAFVPKNELWVDECLSPADATATLLHEFVEYRLMQEGLSYEDAHDKASAAESKLRQRLGTLKRVDLGIVARYKFSAHSSV